MHLQNKSNFLSKHRFHYDFLGQCHDISSWQEAIDKYDAWNKREKTANIIPKKIHQIWIGSKLPGKYEKYCGTWKKIMPDYEYKLWDEKKIRMINSPLQALFQEAKNPGTKSDIARYMILNEEGGLYVDTDFECIHHLGPCLKGSTFLCGQAPANEVGTICYLNGLIASIPEHKIIKDIISELIKVEALDETNTTTIMDNTGPLLLTRWIEYQPADNSIGCLPSNYFYPWPAFMKEATMSPSQYFRECTYAVHHWEGSWFKWIDFEELTPMNKLKWKIRNALSRLNAKF